LLHALQQAAEAAVKIPEVKENLLQQGAEGVGSTSEHLGKVVHAELRKWSELVRDARIQSE
jgi:tripartite-type tricarboxylate transporter receptor subunit TctC